MLVAQCRIAAPLSEVFAFFSEAKNLEELTPPDLSFRILTPEPIEMHPGTVIDYRIRLGPIPLRWRTVIERFEPERLFVDAQHRGPYRSWWHEHHFRADGAHTEMEDRVYYAVPFGPLGRAVNGVFVKRQLRHIFEFRARAMRELFPG
ncbi:MAG: SRPBCC family protein [Polyangiaceae bacterium]|nr:SRPBCC family protein [Polyangiaceae bacterium]